MSASPFFTDVSMATGGMEWCATRMSGCLPGASRNVRVFSIMMWLAHSGAARSRAIPKMVLKTTSVRMPASQIRRPRLNHHITNNCH